MDHQKYLGFKATDFLLDEDFMAWRKRPSAEAKGRWETWLLLYPEKRGEVEQAIELFERLRIAPVFSPEVVPVEQEWTRLRRRIRRESPLRPKDLAAWVKRKWWIAVKILSIT